MNRWSLILGVVMVLGLTKSASAFSAEKMNYQLKVITNMSPNTAIILSKISDIQLQILDTAWTDSKGMVVFEGDGLDESMLCFITFETIKNPGIPVIIDKGSKISVKITKDIFMDVVMNGGKDNASMLKLYNIYSGFERTMTAFNEQVEAIDPLTLTDELRAETTSKYNSLIIQRGADIEEFIKTEPTSLATFFAARYLFNEPVPKLLILARDKMVSDLPNSPYTMNIKNTVEKLGPIEGNIAPEIRLKTPAGDSLSLSSLRGKVVLIDFWASWCGPCRRENPHVKAIYDKYKNQGFEIYGVSLDSKEDSWKAAIAKDGLTWKHVSDLKGWKSSAAQRYKVHSIPSTFLIDREGKIVKSGFRSNELEALLIPIIH